MITALRIPVGHGAAHSCGCVGGGAIRHDGVVVDARFDCSGARSVDGEAVGEWAVAAGRRVTVLTSHTDDLESYGASRRPERLVMRGHRQSLSTRISPGERSGQVNRIERAERSWEGLCRPP